MTRTTNKAKDKHPNPLKKKKKKKNETTNLKSDPMDKDLRIPFSATSYISLDLINILL